MDAEISSQDLIDGAWASPVATRKAAEKHEKAVQFFKRH
jgi:hypothetical protein